MNRPSPAGLEIDHGRFATGPDVLIEAEASMIGRGAGLHRANWAANERSHLILLPSALAPCVEEIFFQRQRHSSPAIRATIER